jgi:hypothetical protein
VLPVSLEEEGSSTRGTEGELGPSSWAGGVDGKDGTFCDTMPKPKLRGFEIQSTAGLT